MADPAAADLARQIIASLDADDPWEPEPFASEPSITELRLLQGRRTLRLACGWYSTGGMSPPRYVRSIAAEVGGEGASFEVSAPGFFASRRLRRDFVRAVEAFCDRRRDAAVRRVLQPSLKLVRPSHG